MADQKDLDYSYSLIDKIFRLSFGETGDFSGAMYNGDFSISIEQAQKQKYEFISKNLNIRQGSKVLDLGCGWGPFLQFIKAKGAKGIGLTLSTAQAKSCKLKELDVHLMDCRKIMPDTFGIFDSITCIGAFEAFCSKEEWQANKQDEIYRKFFKVVHDLLPVGGKFYMQTMTLGRNMIDPENISIKADKNSGAYLCALMEKQFPGHWLPAGEQQILDTARPLFRLLYKSSGRLDYIETQKQWQKKFHRFHFKKYAYFITLIPRFLTNSEFRRRIFLFGVPANRLCFEKEIIDHYRFIFEKV